MTLEQSFYDTGWSAKVTVDLERCRVPVVEQRSIEGAIVELVYKVVVYDVGVVRPCGEGDCPSARPAAGTAAITVKKQLSGCRFST